MKLKPLLLQGIIVSALGIGTADANPLAVYIVAHVTAVDDAAGLLGGQVTIGQVVSGEYRYDTTPSLPPPPPNPYNAAYPQVRGQAASRISVGPLVFETDQQQSPPDIYLQRGDPQFRAPGVFGINSRFNRPLASGATVDDLFILFQDPTGNAPLTVALPTDIPDLTRFTQSTMTVTGSRPWWPDTYSVTFSIDSVNVFPPSAIAAGWSVSPATGVFSRQQNVDLAVLLPAGSQVQTVHSIMGGFMPGPFNFPPLPGPGPAGPAPCSLMPPNSRGQPMLICPNAMSWLPDGVNQVDWQVQLMDGTMLDKGVVWELIP
jgi:hypothetical protein